MRINLVTAINRRNVIGINGKIPWHNSEDLKNFKRLTRGNIVVMGRNTYESIGGPLSDRMNIVVSHRPMKWQKNLAGLWFYQVKTLIDIYRADNIYIIGGRSIYEQFAPIVDRIYLTIIDDHTDASTALYFPWEAFENTSWKVTDEQHWKDATYLIMDKVP